MSQVKKGFPHTRVNVRASGPCETPYIVLHPPMLPLSQLIQHHFTRSEPVRVTSTTSTPFAAYAASSSRKATSLLTSRRAIQVKLQLTPYIARPSSLAQDELYRIIRKQSRLPVSGYSSRLSGSPGGDYRSPHGGHSRKLYARQ